MPRIVVCLKQVIDTRLPLRAEGGLVVADLGRLGGCSGIDPASRAALEVAFAIRRESAGLGEAEIEVFSAGPPEWEETLRLALGRGVERAVRIDLDEGRASDAAASARVLAEALCEGDARGEEGGDAGLAADGTAFVLTGSRSADLGTGLVPAYLAERLGLPYIDSVVGVRTENGAAEVTKRLARGGRETVRVSGPAVLAVHPEAALPHYVSIDRVRRYGARVECVRPLPEESSGAPPSFPSLVPPRPRPVRKALEKTRGSAAQRLSAALGGAIQAGGGSYEQADFVEGDPDRVASKIITFLRERGFLDSEERK